MPVSYGALEKMTKATHAFTDTTIAERPSTPTRPNTSVQTASSAMLRTGNAPVDAPANAEIASAALAASIAPTRVRYTPWRDASPVTSAPYAADAPAKG